MNTWMKQHKKNRVETVARAMGGADFSDQELVDTMNVICNYFYAQMDDPYFQPDDETKRIGEQLQMMGECFYRLGCISLGQPNITIWSSEDM